jgi:hypothetical protein
VIIDINQDLRVRFDSTCWSLEKRQKIENGKFKGDYRWIGIGYYSGVEQAFYAVLNKHMNLLTNEAQLSVQQGVDAMKQHSRQLTEIAKNRTVEP